MEMLRDLARSSPLSEWKFFVRRPGRVLSRRRCGDPGQLGPPRPEADGLRRSPSGCAEMAAEAAGRTRPSLESMEKLVFGEPILDRLRQVRDLRGQP